MKMSRKSKKYERTIIGLRDALFDELEDIRDGVSAPHEAIAFSKLAQNIITTVEVELKKEILQEAKARRESHDKELERRHTRALFTHQPNEIDLEEEDYEETPLPSLSTPFEYEAD